MQFTKNKGKVPCFVKKNQSSKSQYGFLVMLDVPVSFCCCEEHSNRDHSNSYRQKHFIRMASLQF